MTSWMTIGVTNQVKRPVDFEHFKFALKWYI